MAIAQIAHDTFYNSLSIALIKIFESLTIEDAENCYRAFENSKNSKLRNFLWKRILQPFYERQLENHVAGELNSMAPKSFLKCFD